MTNVPPNGWRAGIGLVPPADGGPAFPGFPGGLAMPGFFPGFMYGMPMPMPMPPGPGFYPGPSPSMPSYGAAPASIFFGGLPGAPTGFSQVPNGGLLLPALPAPPAAEKADAEMQTSGSLLPGGARAGYNTIFQSDYCLVHAITSGSKAATVGDWGAGTSFTFNGHQVPTSMTVKDFVAAIDGPSNWVLTEIFERPGGGGWAKGTSIQSGDDKAKKPIADLGWDSRRGRENEPVWCIVEKEE